MQKSEQEPKVQNFCRKCERSFTFRNGFVAHVKKFHPEDAESISKVKVICPLCESNQKSIVELHKHFQDNHGDVPLKHELKTFYSEEDFHSWKKVFEQESLSQFTKRRSAGTLADGKKVERYFCHRSGHYKTEGKNKRRLKVKGSNKIEKSCPAHLKVIYEEADGLIEIKAFLQTVHVGHDCEIERISLPKSERDEIARKLLIGTPKSTVLKDIQHRYSPTKRVSYVCRKDLHNIIRDYHLNSGIRLRLDNLFVIDENNQRNLHVKEKEALDTEIKFCNLPRISIEERKLNLQADFLSQLSEVKTEDGIKVVKDVLDLLKSKLLVVNTINPITSFPEPNKAETISNLNKEPQRKFQKSKKRKLDV